MLIPVSVPWASIYWFDDDLRKSRALAPILLAEINIRFMEMRSQKINRSHAHSNRAQNARFAVSIVAVQYC